MNAKGLTVSQSGNLDATAYGAFLARVPDAMFNHSYRYLCFLQRILGGRVEPCHFIATREGILVGVLPAFVSEGPLGPVVNSLPFFGSHGGAVVYPDEKSSVVVALSEAFNNYCDSISAFSSTVIESPFTKLSDNPNPYRANLFDDRVGQVSKLPLANLINEAEALLIQQCHSKTRNLIRKGLKTGFEIVRSCAEKDMRSLWNLHLENMSAIGGMAKQWSVFEAIMESFEAEKDYHIYLALADRQVAAALLVFFFKDTVEYFTPVVAAEFRSDQPLNVLILRAMTDAILERKARCWNWGGTWRNQEGVYHFKSRWGANDHIYRYHIHLNTDKMMIQKARMLELVKSYPYFYTLPFSLLEKV